MFHFILVIAVPCILVYSSGASAYNTRPIIGVLAQSTEEGSPGDTYIMGAYVKWLQSAGARVVPIKVKEKRSYYERIFRGINAVLFPGGDVGIVSSYYAKAAHHLYHMALKANDEGDYFPLWGTCLGSQLLTALTAGEDLMADRSFTGMLPLNLTCEYKDSRLFKDLPDDVFKALVTQNVTANHHHFGLTLKNYSQNAKLKKFYKVLSTDLDDSGKHFISTFEDSKKYLETKLTAIPSKGMTSSKKGTNCNVNNKKSDKSEISTAYKYPIYGLQWHPEKNIYDWSLNDKYINHDAIAVRVSTYFASFLVEESKKSNHAFSCLEEEMDELIDNYNPIFSRDKNFWDTYYFNFTSD